MDSSTLTTQNGGNFATNTTPTPTYANLYAPLNWPPTRPYNGVKDHTFYIVFTFIYIFFISSLIGSSYVIYRTYMKWKSNNYETLPMSLRLPFYCVITDFLTIIAHLINTGHAAIYAVPWFSPVCEIIGALSVWTLNLNIYLFLVATISTYLRAALPLLLFINGEFGGERWWCAGKNNDSTLGIMGVIATTMVVITVSFAYFRILKLLVRHRSQLRERLDNHTFSDFEHRIARNVARYILLFLLQWLPIGVFTALHLSGNEEAWVYMLVIE
ncbi:5180_t:CDS:2 [Ambispora gerdemannii]|uniref:5180_t:CDS:1 n=1 Tax=Ambispora gerdemannii TaxID=144530 RepID=A0A9N8ZF78_9GLOM|nr:5180_t:CDS:2 [Ambispora gerdemannii]